MQAARRVKWTEEEYLERERRSQTRNEFLEGEIYAMAGARLRHNTIAANMIIALGGLLRGKPCRVFTGDQRICVIATGLYTYPDAGVICGRAQLHEKDGLTLLNPTLLVEVLSRSTAAYDRGEKLDHYRNIPSLREVLIVAQSERLVEHHRRLQDNEWLMKVCREGMIEVPLLGGAVSLDDIYEKIDVSEPDTD